MGRDESGTVARLKQNRAERLEPIFAKYGGRLVKVTGDGAQIEFTSAVDALSAMIEFQQAMAEVNRGQSPATALVFRMGFAPGRSDGALPTLGRIGGIVDVTDGDAVGFRAQSGNLVERQRRAGCDHQIVVAKSAAVAVRVVMRRSARGIALSWLLAETP